MTDEKIIWVAVDGTPTAEEMGEFKDALRGEFDHDLILATKEVEPYSKEEVKEWVDELREGLE